MGSKFTSSNVHNIMILLNSKEIKFLWVWISPATVSDFIITHKGQPTKLRMCIQYKKTMVSFIIFECAIV